MNKQNAATEIRKYEQEGYLLITICKRRGHRVGSGVCNRCNLFKSMNYDRKEVTCYHPTKVLF